MKYLASFKFLCLLAACSLISAACSDVIESKSFPQEYSLTSEHISLGPSFIPYSPSAMELKSGFLIFNTFLYVQIYSVPDLSVTCTLGDRDRSDLQTPQILRSSSPYLYIMDVNNKNEVRKYSIDSLGQPILLQTGFAGVNTAMNRPYILHDSLIVYDEFVPEASLKIYNLHTNTEILTLPYGTTSINDRFFDKNMGGLYANDFCMAFAYKYQDRVDFYDWQFNLIRSVNNQKSEPEINIRNDIFAPRPNNINYYGFSFMGRNYFYTLYRGVTNKVFRSDSLPILGGLDHIYGITRDVLEVYDMDGQPVCRFRFNDVAPEVFVVDEEQNILYGYRQAFPATLLAYHLQGLSKNGQQYPKSTKPVFSSLPFSSRPDTPEEPAYFETASTHRDEAPTYWIHRFLDRSGYRPAVSAGNFGLTELSRQE
ncbi:MAG: hypothetical protein FWE30_07265 [Bacteroidales bacterium]|nr:hypothetical protein [Bacteroidales bacterium]